MSGLVLALELRRSSDVPRYCGGGVCRTLSLGNNSSITAERSRLAKYEISQNFSSLTQMINFNVDVISSIISLNPFEIINMRERGSFIKIQSKDCIRQGEFEMCSCFAIDLKLRLKLEFDCLFDETTKFNKDLSFFCEEQFLVEDKRSHSPRLQELSHEEGQGR